MPIITEESSKQSIPTLLAPHVIDLCNSPYPLPNGYGASDPLLVRQQSTSVICLLSLLLLRTCGGGSTQIGGGRALLQVDRAGGGNGAPVRAGGPGAAGLRTAAAIAGPDPRDLHRRLPLRPPRHLAHLRYPYSVLLIHQLPPACSPAPSPRIHSLLELTFYCPKLQSCQHEELQRCKIKNQDW